MTAEHGGAEGAGEYAGMDALMAAITGEALPDEARRDAAFLAEHRSAEADVAVLKEQLAWLAEALTGERPAGEPAAGDAEASAAQEPEPTESRGAAGSTESAGSAESSAGAGSTGPARSAQPGQRTRSATRPVGPERPARPPLPGRPSGPRRALRIALGSLAGVAAFSLVVGLGWLATHSGADDSMSGSAADAKSADTAPAQYSGDDGRPSDPASALACYKLVAEGIVSEVAPQEQTPWTRIALTVTRSYKPAHGPAEVTFLLDNGAEPGPRKGQHVLIGVDRGQDNAGLWAVGDARVAANRAWITEALPTSRHTACPSAEPTGEP
ncbi:hypothetical protein [Streptomyces sp. NPDC007905]|uniref:hypothetical protein n=1 Tax=Streptomyces sp. NPDC007905 TaxID=3364788 RepID=UPI0036E7B1B4